jgi:hypothetical protein
VNEKANRKWDVANVALFSVITLLMVVWVFTPECYWHEVRLPCFRVAVASLVTWILYRTLND